MRKAQLTPCRYKEREVKERKKIALWQAFSSRGLYSQKTDKPPELEDAQISLTDPLDAESSLQFPVMLLYPLHAQSDFIKAFTEIDTLAQHLEYILPLPWDEAKEYGQKGVEAYAETRDGGLTKVGKAVKLIEVLQKGSVEIVDDLVKIYILPKAKAGEWIEEMRKRKGK